MEKNEFIRMLYELEDRLLSVGIILHVSTMSVEGAVRINGVPALSVTHGLKPSAVPFFHCQPYKVGDVSVYMTTESSLQKEAETIRLVLLNAIARSADNLALRHDIPDHILQRYA